jgi:hypothetical protein
LLKPYFNISTQTVANQNQNPLPVCKNKRLATAMVPTKYERHIEIKRNAAVPGPAASSNYILSIIFLLK